MNTSALYLYLHQHFKYEDGYLISFKRLKTGKPVGFINTDTGYVQVGINKKLYQAHRLIFLYHKGYLPKTIDHIDQNKSNNKIENLREVTTSENCHNQTKRKTNKSGYKGVSYHKASKKWAAQVCIQYKKTMIGLFPTPELAYEAYCNYAKNNLIVFSV
jgi:hypothetical protein